jgi:hypothetical protein
MVTGEFIESRAPIGKLLFALCESTRQLRKLWSAATGSLVSAKGAGSHVRAWGSAPGSNCGGRNQALKARLNPVDAFLISNELVSDMNRAVSAGAFFCHPSWGGALGLEVNAAPVALNTRGWRPVLRRTKIDNGISNSVSSRPK